jgi:hypothetical protein
MFLLKYSASILFGHEEGGTWALGLSGSQEKAAKAVPLHAMKTLGREEV